MGIDAGGIFMQAAVVGQTESFMPAIPDRILVATDMTDTDALVPHAIAQARASGAEVMLLHAVAEGAAVDEAEGAYLAKVKRLRDLRVELLGVARRFESQGIACATAVRNGAASEVICAELDRRGVSRIILGAGGRDGAGQFSPGSVARELNAKLGVPVSVVGMNGMVLPAGS
jgi:nucleotide-binding universal stress UspA family protein